MPNIRTLTADPRGIVRTVDDRSGQIIGGAISEFGGQVSEVGAAFQRLDNQRDVSRLTKEATEAQTRLLKQWQQTIREADPNDKEVASRFMSEVFAPEMEALGAEGSITRQAKAHLDQLKVGMSAHFDRTTFKDSAELVGLAAENNFHTMVNELSTQASIDFENVDAYLAMARSAEEGFIASGGSREAVLKMREETDNAIALGAINGYIDDDPEAAKQDLDSGAFGDILTGAEQKRLSNYATTLINTRNNELRRINQDNANLASSNTLENIIAGGATEDMLKEIVTNPAYDTPEGASQQRIMFNLIQSMANDSSKGAKPRPRDNEVFDGLLSRIQLPRGHEDRPTPEEIISMTNRGLTMTDTNFLMKRLEGADTPEGQIFNDTTNRFLKFSKTFLVGSDFDPIANPAGMQAYNAFTLAAQEVIDREREAGLTSQEIFGNDGTIAKMLPSYKVSRSSAIESFRGALGGELDLGDVEFLTGEEAIKAAEEVGTEATVADMDKFLEGK